MGFEFVGVLCCELCGSMVDCRNPKVFAKKLDLGLDKSSNVVYNILMIRNNNTSERKKMLHLNEIVAIKMQDGLKRESAQIAEIGQVLVTMGKSRTERIWLLSHDEDFIPDVLSCYNHRG